MVMHPKSPDIRDAMSVDGAPVALDLLPLKELALVDDGETLELRDNAARRAALAAEIGVPTKRPDVWFMARGPDVEYLQQQLEVAGLYSVADGDQPGLFAHMTERALRAFQTARGLPVNGYCGPETWAALR